MNFILVDLYKQAEKWKNIKEYVINNKENFLNEEFYKLELERVTKKITSIYEEIKSYK